MQLTRVIVVSDRDLFFVLVPRLFGLLYGQTCNVVSNRRFIFNIYRLSFTQGILGLEQSVVFLRSRNYTKFEGILN